MREQEEEKEEDEHREEEDETRREDERMRGQGRGRMVGRLVRSVEGAGFYLYHVTANQRPCGVRREVKKGTRSPLLFCYTRAFSPPLSFSLYLCIYFRLSYCLFVSYLSHSYDPLPLRFSLRKLVNRPLVFRPTFLTSHLPAPDLHV